MTKCGYLCFGVFILLAITCGRGNEAAQQNEELSFVVLDSLLGPSFTDTAIAFSFHPPKGWEKVPDSTMKKARHTIVEMVGQDSSISVTPVSFFVDPHGGSVCCLSQLTVLKGGARIFEKLNEYGTRILKKFPASKIDEGSYRVNDVNVFQYLITDDERVMFKLLCCSPQGRMFQLDYIVPRSMYAQQIKAIESSIGSFQILP
jgi:hypothetical protein